MAAVYGAVVSSVEKSLGGQGVCGGHSRPAVAQHLPLETITSMGQTKAVRKFAALLTRAVKDLSRVYGCMDCSERPHEASNEVPRIIAPRLQMYARPMSFPVPRAFAPRTTASCIHLGTFVES